MKHALRAMAGAVLLAAAGWSIASADTPSVEPPSPPQAPPASESLAAPSVAIVATEPGTGRSRLFRVDTVPLGSPASEGLEPLTEFSHLPEGNVRAEVVPGSNVVLANAPTRLGRDMSFNGALVALRSGAAPAELCRDVVHASRPLVTDTGRVFVSRGRAGPWPDAPGAYRTDELTIDELEVADGTLRRVHAFKGYLAHLAGWYGAELLIYRVGPDGADIVRVHADSGAVRAVQEQLPPFARDFSVDSARGALVYRGRHETDSRRWTIEEVLLSSGDTRRLYEGPSFAMSPHVWPGGGVVFSPEQRGWALIGSADPVTSPMDAGVDLLRDVSTDRRFVAALHTEAGELDTPFVVDRKTGAVGRLAAPAGHRIAIAGFVEQGEDAP